MSDEPTLIQLAVIPGAAPPLAALAPHLRPAPWRSLGRAGSAATPPILTPMPDTHHLSRSAFERLHQEHGELTTRGRVDIARKIEAARELGDLSENGDYHAAKEEQGKMEARIRQLETLIKNAEIVEGGSTDEVTAGSIVEIRFESSDDTERYLIGSIEERHSDYEVISPGSPLGTALLGHKIGEVVDFETPRGVNKVEIVSLEG